MLGNKIMPIYQNKVVNQQFGDFIALQQLHLHQFNDADLQNFKECQKKLESFIRELEERRPQDYPFHISSQILCYLGYSKKSSISAQTILQIAAQKINRMKIYKKQKKYWGKQDVLLLVWLVSYTYGNEAVNHPQNIPEHIWQKIAELIPGTNQTQCMFKWLSLKYVHNTIYHWQKNEQNLLKNIVQQQDKKNSENSENIKKRNWNKISRLLYLLNKNIDRKYRNGKQCQQRWYNFLQPDIKKGNWTLQEDRILLNCLKQTNHKRWRQFLQQLPGRTQNAAKNRFSLIVSRYRQIRSKAPESLIVDLHLMYIKVLSKQIPQKTETKVDQKPQLLQIHQQFIENNVDQLVHNGKENLNNKNSKGLQQNKVCIFTNVNVSHPLNHHLMQLIVEAYQKQFQINQQPIKQQKLFDINLLRDEIDDFMSECSESPLNNIPTRKTKCINKTKKGDSKRTNNKKNILK